MGERMVKFLKLKDKMIFKKKRKHLFNKKDYEEAMSWDNEFEDDFYIYILQRYTNDLSDSEICPWCHKYDNENIFIDTFGYTNCTDYDNCAYGKRHGNCKSDSYSTYQSIANSGAITSLFTDEELDLLFDTLNPLSDTDEGA